MSYKRVSPQPVPEGGTGAISLTNHGVLVGAGTAAITQLAGASSGTVLIGNSAADPSFSASPVVTSITIMDLPVVGTDGANKTYVDSVASGFNFITAVQAATTANLTALYLNGAAGVGATLTNSGTQAAFAVDGYSASINDRILVKDQSTTFQNGIYTVTTVGTGASNWVLTRATDYDQPSEINPGDLVPVVNGTANANTIWLENATVVTIGVDPIIFVKFAGGIQSLVADDAGSATGANVMVHGGANIATTASGNTLVIDFDGVLPIANGGTNASSMAVTDGTVIFDGTRLVTTATGTSGQVLTSNGTGVAPTYQNSASSGINTIDGNSGSVTGSTVTIKATQGTSAFTGSGTTLTQTFTDFSDNTCIGLGTQTSLDPLLNTALGAFALAANTGIGSDNNVAIGANCLSQLTLGTYNVAISNAGGSLKTGNYNTLVGSFSGVNYTGSESSNICIGYNANGATGTSNRLIIGAATGTGLGELNNTVIYGIDGTNVGSVAKVVTMASNRLGTASIVGGTGITVTPTANTITITASGAGVASVTGGNNIAITGTGTNPIVNVSGTTNHSVQVGASTGALTSLTVGTNGQVLVGSSAANPVFATLASSDSSITYATGAGTLGLTVTPATTTQLGGTTLATNAETILGTNTTKIVTPDDLKAKLGVQTVHGVMISEGTNQAITSTAAGTAGQVLQSGGASADPLYSTSTYPSTNAQGDLIYGSALNALSTLAKSAAATRYLANTGASNNPNWDQVSLSTGVTSVLPIANGGTNASSMGTSDGTVYFDGTRLATTTAGTSGQLLTSNGVGVAPTYQTFTASGFVTSVVGGTNIAIGGTSTVPIVNFSGTLPIASGGTNTTSFAVTDGTVYFDGTKLTTTATGTANQVLMSNGAGVAPTYQNISAAGVVTSVSAGNSISVSGTASAPIVNVAGTVNHALQVGNSTASLTSLASGSLGQLLQSQGSLANPAFTTTTYPATSAQGDLIYASALNVYSNLAKSASSTRYLANTGTSNAPQWDQVSLTTGITGVLPIANGGTNASSFATTDGTVIYDGTRLVTTTTGTSGQVLTSNGAGVAPTYQAVSSGSLILIGSQSVSSGSSLTFNLNASYSTYKLEYNNVAFTTAVGATDLQMQVSSDGGSTWKVGTSGTTQYWNAGGTTINAGVPGQMTLFTHGGNPIVTSGSATMTGMESTSLQVNVYGQYFNSNTLGFAGSLRNSDGTAMNAIKIVVGSGGVFLSGNFCLYGLVQ